MSDATIGTVKWFNVSTGFGIIERSYGSDVFVHSSAMADSGIDALIEGQLVKFDVIQGQKWPQATNIVAI